MLVIKKPRKSPQNSVLRLMDALLKTFPSFTVNSKLPSSLGAFPAVLGPDKNAPGQQSSVPQMLETAL